MTELHPAYTIGVIADTHIPDRVRALHPEILPIFHAARVCHILHAGDISVASVLDNLREIAPVTAVRGNRDFVAGVQPMDQVVAFGSVHVALLHGHGGWIPYLKDKWKFLMFGYQRERYLPLLRRTAPSAGVLVFGHTHYAENFTLDGRLVLNPGSASCWNPRGDLPSIALLKIDQLGNVTSEIIPLRGWRQIKCRWVAD